jgi:von Willebrand factor type A domain
VNGALEFALALDTTKSMETDNRIGGLKTAANNFIDILFDMKDRGADVQGAIVPFARYVNVGVSRRNEPWMDAPKDVDTRKTVEKCGMVTPVVGEKDCKTVITAAHTINHPAVDKICWLEDGFKRCSDAKPAWTENVAARKDTVCEPIYGPAKKECKIVQTGSLTKWKGCVSSREDPLNVTEAYDGNKFPGVMKVKCGSEIQPLTDSRSSLVKKINGLVTDDDTYIPEGVMWGMRMLTKSQPFTEGKPATGNAKPVRKALVVMTDGKNSVSPTTEPSAEPWKDGISVNKILHIGGDESLANKYTTKACNAAKAEGIEVYTISFGNEVPNEIRDLLQDCATKPQLYFHASDSAALNKAFSDIADELLSIRLTQ